MAATTSTEESSIRYSGWRVVAVCFAMAVVCWGFGFYGHAFYLAELRRVQDQRRASQHRGGETGHAGRKHERGHDDDAAEAGAVQRQADGKTALGLEPQPQDVGDRARLADRGYAAWLAGTPVSTGRPASIQSCLPSA